MAATNAQFKVRKLADQFSFPTEQNASTSQWQNIQCLSHLSPAYDFFIIFKALVQRSLGNGKILHFLIVGEEWQTDPLFFSKTHISHSQHTLSLHSGAKWNDFITRVPHEFQDLINFRNATTRPSREHRLTCLVLCRGIMNTLLSAYTEF